MHVKVGVLSFVSTEVSAMQVKRHVMGRKVTEKLWLVLGVKRSQNLA